MSSDPHNARLKESSALAAISRAIAAGSIVTAARPSAPVEKTPAAAPAPPPSARLVKEQLKTFKEKKTKKEQKKEKKKEQKKEKSEKKRAREVVEVKQHPPVGRDASDVAELPSKRSSCDAEGAAASAGASDVPAGEMSTRLAFSTPCQFPASTSSTPRSEVAADLNETSVAPGWLSGRPLDAPLSRVLAVRAALASSGLDVAAARASFLPHDPAEAATALMLFREAYSRDLVKSFADELSGVRDERGELPEAAAAAAVRVALLGGADELASSCPYLISL